MAGATDGGVPNDYLIYRTADSDDYSIWRVDLDSSPLLRRVTQRGTKFSRTHKLISVGNYMLEWGPVEQRQRSDGGIYPFRLFQFDAASPDPLADTQTTLVQRGNWAKSKFWWLVPDFGSPQGPQKEFMKVEELTLVPVGTFLLFIVPTLGRGTFKLFQFDPQAGDYVEGMWVPDPVQVSPTILGRKDDFSVVLGSFETIEFGHELIPFGDYVLDWLPEEQKFWLWSFDPMAQIPLGRPAVQEGSWQAEGIDRNHQLVAIGNHLLDWDTTTGEYRLWELDPKAKKVVTNPLRGQMPDEFHGSLEANNKISLTAFQDLRSIDQEKKNEPGTIDFMRSKIDHVVYYMVENRSFDHVCGWLYEHDPHVINFVGHKEPFRGADLAMFNIYPADNSEVHVKKTGPDVTLHRFDPYHDASDALRQCFFPNRDGYAKHSEADMGGFVWNNGDEAVMSTSTPDQLPVLNGLAKSFSVCDEWFCSMPGATDAQRAFALTGSSLRELNNFMSGSKYDDWPEVPHRASIWKVLWANGQTDWKIYNSVPWWNYVLSYQLFLKGQIPSVDAEIEASRQKGGKSKYLGTLDDFFDDVQTGNLPGFSYIEPVWIEAPGIDKPATSYHPLGLTGVAPAEAGLNAIYEALRDSDLWERTLLIVTFDEHGGFYDHVSPPYAENPWPNDIVDGFKFDLMGVRVPTILVSPWIKAHTVFRTPNPLDYGAAAPPAYDSTSILATLLKWYGIPKARWGLGRRTDQAPTFEAVFQSPVVRGDKPAFTPPAPPEKGLAFADYSQQPVSDLQREHIPRIISAIVGDKCTVNERRSITSHILTHANSVDTYNKMLDDLMKQFNA
jgi:phospholipase C